MNIILASFIIVLCSAGYRYVTRIECCESRKEKEDKERENYIEERYGERTIDTSYEPGSPKVDRPEYKIIPGDGFDIDPNVGED